jgi:hypothetical protein
MTGNAVIETSGQVDVNLGGGEIGGDLTVKKSGNISVSDCSAVPGTVTPENICAGG